MPGLVRLLSAVLLTSLSHAPIASAQDSDNAEQVEQKLQTVIEQIAAIERELLAGEGEKDKLSNQLRTAEREIGGLGRQLRELDQAIQAQDRELSELEQQQRVLRQRLGTQSDALGNQIRSAYLLGRQHRIKLLLNMEDLSAASRTLGYYGYFNRARRQLIEQFDQELSQAKRLSAAIADIRSRQQANRQQALRRQKQQQQAVTNRRQLLAGLIDQLGKRRDELSQLNADQAQLSLLLERLRDIFADIPETLDQQAPAFGTLRGKLNWPIVGALREPPGRAKSGGLDRNGAVIAAAMGTEVKAMAHGRVAFADWLRGFGLLLIVDHGDDYLTLYGFNDALFRDVGDWVLPGEPIAAVGNSGGRLDSGLYFELRHRGKPIDPLSWLTENTP